MLLSLPVDVLNHLVMQVLSASYHGTADVVCLSRTCHGAHEICKQHRYDVHATHECITWCLPDPREHPIKHRIYSSSTRLHGARWKLLVISFHDYISFYLCTSDADKPRVPLTFTLGTVDKGGCIRNKRSVENHVFFRPVDNDWGWHAFLCNKDIECLLLDGLLVMSAKLVSHQLPVGALVSVSHMGQGVIQRADVWSYDVRMTDGITLNSYPVDIQPHAEDLVGKNVFVFNGTYTGKRGRVLSKCSYNSILVWVAFELQQDGVDMVRTIDCVCMA